MSMPKEMARVLSNWRVSGHTCYGAFYSITCRGGEAVRGSSGKFNSASGRQNRGRYVVGFSFLMQLSLAVSPAPSRSGTTLFFPLKASDQSF